MPVFNDILSKEPHCILSGKKLKQLLFCVQFPFSITEFTWRNHRFFSCTL